MRHKLTDEQLAEAAARYAAGGITIAQLSSRYGLAKSALAFEIRRRGVDTSRKKVAGDGPSPLPPPAPEPRGRHPKPLPWRGPRHA